MKVFQRTSTFFCAALSLSGSPLLVRAANAQTPHANPPRTTADLAPLVEALLAATTNFEDTDGDGLPDSVELVIGTDPGSADSDLDRLADGVEIDGGLDPREPDSNFDGLPDYYEVQNVHAADADGDGIPNEWDADNDGDGVNDGTDLSPFQKADVADVFHFDITTNGGPTYVSFQIRPDDAEHLRLFGRSWDWPDNDRAGAIQDWDGSKEDLIAVPTLELTLSEVPDEVDVIAFGITIDGHTASVPLLPVTENGTVVAFAGRMPYPTATPATLSMDARLVWKVVGKNDTSATELGQTVLLARYPDRFSLVGTTVEESFGSDAAVFYGDDVSRLMAANLLLSYQFLRNEQSHAADMAAILQASGVSVSHQSGAFAHNDAALVALENEMIPAALASLPTQASLPAVCIVESRSAALDLSEFSRASDGSFAVDLAAEQPITSKTLKTRWYDTTSRQPIALGDAMANIVALGQTDATAYALMTLNLYWNAGEQTLEGMGDVSPVPPEEYELASDTVDDMVATGLTGIELLYRGGLGLEGLRAYRSIKLLQSSGWSLSYGPNAIADIAKLGNFGKFQTWVQQCDRLTASSKLFKTTKALLGGLNQATVFLDAGFAAYTVVALSQMSDISSMQKTMALMQTVLEYYYSLVIFAIAAIPVAGWVIAIGIEVSDIIGGWSDKLIQWIVDSLTDVEAFTTPSISAVGDPVLSLDDKDGDGLDVGDRLQFESRLRSEIVGSVPGAYWNIVRYSDVYPYYRITAPAGSASTTGAPHEMHVYTHFGSPAIPVDPVSQTYTENEAASWTVREYDSAVWVEPGTAMVNFPVYITTEAVGQLWYAWKWFSFAPFPGMWGWQQSESRTDVNQILGTFPLYWDVMPASLDDFVRWRSIASLDHDGDGLSDATEGETSNPWLYDTDGDGLSDKYEKDNGLDAKAHDSDGDGLDDWLELQVGTDPKDPDTDDDGLVDYLEVAGWLIELEYGGKTFVARVYSRPTIPDSDGDGVSDYQEYWSGTNPGSRDTNADGVDDVAQSRLPTTTVAFARSITFDVTDVDLDDLAVDAAGSVYVLFGAHEYSVVKKYDSDLNEVPGWAYSSGSGTRDLCRDILIDDQRGLLHVGHGCNARADILTLSLADGSPMGDSWATRADVGDIYALALGTDPDGNVYVGRSGNWCNWDWDNWLWGVNSFVDVYDAERSFVRQWGDYAWNHEIDKIAYVEDIAFNPVNHLLYVADLGMDMTYVFLGYRFRPDRVAVFTTDGAYQRDITGYYRNGESYVFDILSSLDVDSDGFLYVCDASNYRVHKLDPNGVGIASWGGYGTDDGLFVRPPTKTVVDASMNVFVLEGPEPEGDRIARIHKFTQTIEYPDQPPAVADDDPDRDRDGLTNAEETAGWEVAFVDGEGSHGLHVTSDPLLVDTDGDGVDDLRESRLGTDPRSPDTDHDGLGDLGDPSPLHFDGDGDGLPDGVEQAYGSDPTVADEDGDGLGDADEFRFGADPGRADTDGDGLNDAAEASLGTSVVSPDTDGDLVFDGTEVGLGTEARNGDSDGDGMTDGLEYAVYGTQPGNADTDGDGIDDGSEVSAYLNPLSPDSDGDGISDGAELEAGTDPWSSDSDHDGVPDGEDDPDNLAPDVGGAHPIPDCLWPPNGKYAQVAIQGVTDPEGDAVQMVITSVTSDEPSSSRGTCVSARCGRDEGADAYVSDDGRLYLRARRSGAGGGRVYEVGFAAGDDRGGVTFGKVQVRVPHSRAGGACASLDDGQSHALWP